MDEAPKSPTLVALGQTIRLYREASGLTQRALADKISYSNGWLGEVETGTQQPAPKALTKIEDVLGIPAGVLGKILSLTTTEAKHPVESFDRFRRVEQEATEIFEYEALIVPGLLQTEDYARALLMAEQPHAKAATIDGLVALRMERQAIIGGDNPPVIHLVITEAALRQPVGTPEVHRHQLDKLLTTASQPGLTVQAIPQAIRDRAGMAGSFRIMEFTDRPRVAYSEDHVSGHIHEQPELVRAMWRSYDAIRSSALNAPDSLEFIKKVREEV